MTNPFDYVKSVSETKKELMRDESGKIRYDAEYNPYLTNRALSNHPDSILHANEMNRLHDLPEDAQYRYYLNSLRSRKRYGKWNKPSNPETLEMIRTFFGCNANIAKQYLTTLTNEQMEAIIKTMEKGGA